MTPKRIVLDLMVSPEHLTFENDEQLQAFQQALGRQIMYAIKYGGEESDTVARGGVYLEGADKNIEILLTYISVEQSQNIIIAHTGIKHGFTMAAVSRNNRTEYTFHS